jgi:hypothetical protein
MIDLDAIEEWARNTRLKECKYLSTVSLIELITHLRQAEKLNAELKDRISKIGMDVESATTGQIPSEHPIKSRLEMVANLAKDAARYRWALDNCLLGIGRNGATWDLQFEGPAPDHIGQVSGAIDEAMQCK